jgi:hypothetical protein
VGAVLDAALSTSVRDHIAAFAFAMALVMVMVEFASCESVTESFAMVVIDMKDL